MNRFLSDIVQEISVTLSLLVQFLLKMAGLVTHRLCVGYLGGLGQIMLGMVFQIAEVHVNHKFWLYITNKFNVPEKSTFWKPACLTSSVKQPQASSKMSRFADIQSFTDVRSGVNESQQRTTLNLVYH